MKQKLSTIALKNLFTFIFISATISGLTFGEDIYVGNDYPMHIENDTAYSDVLQSDSDSIIITNLQVASGEPYEVVYDGLHEGAPVYIDRDYTITGYPEYLEGTVYIKTANDDKYRVEVDF